ncbi:PEP/pyruvate-binding domain-containing protein [Kribbella sp. NPDC048928]|uniref:PEP/pyruvate-binding domain-containing protein n=1 Tax=Kribbella sp. NPDC048928 TaxID=3364111 RepID=UPI0037111F39
MDQPRIVWLTDEAGTDLATVGGKNASLGIMLRELGETGIKVPEGFATTAAAYREYVETTGLKAVIGRQICRYRGKAALASVGAGIREAFAAADLPMEVEFPGDPAALTEHGRRSKVLTDPGRSPLH